jgi:DNA-binding MarR family transcriptional regulator
MIKHVIFSGILRRVKFPWSNEETLNMTIDFESDSQVLRLWRQVYQTYALLKRCEDQIIGEHGLTTEQYAVLVSIDYLGAPARVTDIARWLERSANSISMIVDRMVKAGLVRRARDKRDRRVVNVTFTSKGENALEPSTRAMFQVIQKIMLSLSFDDRSALLSLLKVLTYEILEYLNPGVNVKEMKINESERDAKMREWLLRHSSPSVSQAKRQSRAKKRTVRRK